MDATEFAEYVKDRYEQDPNGRMDRFGKDFVASPEFNIRVIYEASKMSWGESYFSTQFGGCQDYGDRYDAIQEGEMTEAELEQEARDRISRHPRYIQFYNKDEETVITGVAVLLKQDGYTIYPDPEKTVQV